jgi:5-methylthioribose kinase
MSVELLDEKTVVGYLTRRGLIDSPAVVEILTGGVSNVVLAIGTATQDYVVKQALPELKVAIRWEADQRRAIVEANAMKLLHQITPESVPELVDFDPIEFTVTMTRLPRSATNWKVDMLEGIVHPSIGADLGIILAKWHNFGATHPSARDEFMEDSLFDQLRVTPFYRAVAVKNPDFELLISQLVDEITTVKVTLVHGDFSPKNIMISTNLSPIVLDFEVMHTGNPVFDIAFLCAHLLCKKLRSSSQVERDILVETTRAFLSSYQSLTIIPVSPSFTHHVAVIALARVEGVSPVDYLDEDAKIRVQELTKTILRNPKVTIEELFK